MKRNFETERTSKFILMALVFCKNHEGGIHVYGSARIHELVPRYYIYVLIK